MMFADYRTVSELLALMMVVKFNETPLFLDFFELITKNLFSRACTRGQTSATSSTSSTSSTGINRFRNDFEIPRNFTQIIRQQ